MKPRAWARALGFSLICAASALGCAQILGLKEDAPLTPCVLNSDCASNELCIFRVCSPACKLDKDCTPGSRCIDTDGTSACIVASTGQCNSQALASESGCPDGTVCDATQTCRNACTSCHADQTCVDNVCIGTDTAHDPGSVSSADGGGGTSASGGTGGTAGAGEEAGAGPTSTGGKGTAGSGSVAGSGNAGGGPTTVSCGDTAVGDSIACSETPDGTAITFPAGKAQGPCAQGKKKCQADGTFGACVGAVAPGKTDCTSANDTNCNGKPDNTECGVCTLGATQYCYDGAANTQGNGPCKQGTQVCQLDSASQQTVWGACAGEVVPATNDTCDPGNDANCNRTANEGCTCLNGDMASCGSKLGLLGDCAAGVTHCAGGAWGACSVAPKAADTCDKDDDATCNGHVNEGCACINGGTQGCGSTLMGCTTGTQTCQNGGYGSCSGGCSDFSVFPGGGCTATGPKGEDTENNCQITVCPAGYHVTDCALTSVGATSCSFNGALAGNRTVARISTDKPTTATSASCNISSCSCHADGF